jgi:hypothetical protein
MRGDVGKDVGRRIEEKNMIPGIVVGTRNIF